MNWLNDAQFVGQISIGLFLSIVFLQSSLDKIFDWKGNLSWLKEHFSKTFFSGLVTPMLGTLAIVEFATGMLSAIGVLALLIKNDPSFTRSGVYLSLAAYLMLIFGQRVAKDYEGARTIAIYFGVSLLSIFFFN